MSDPPRCRLSRGRRVALAPLREATAGGAPRRPTAVALRDDGERLHVEIAATSPRPWATLAERDADLWTEEVVEIFLAPGQGTPRVYFELEVNPLGALFDARVESPHGDRRGLVVDRAWSCDGLVVGSAIDERRALWRVELALPWAAFGAPPSTATWRLNVYRIDRPAGAPPEFSAWSPTFVSPADFHRPARFGFLDRLG